MGELHQIDTYFLSKKGRFKLREIDGEDYELIYYERPDESEPKISTYEIIQLDYDSAKRMKKVLDASMGIKVIVEKKRELWIYKNTRIHLDVVDGLGEYVELETVVKDAEMKDAEKEHDEVVELLELSQYEKCEMSYSDMLLR